MGSKAMWGRGNWGGSGGKTGGWREGGLDGVEFGVGRLGLSGGGLAGGWGESKVEGVEEGVMVEGGILGVDWWLIGSGDRARCGKK